MRGDAEDPADTWPVEVQLQRHELAFVVRVSARQSLRQVEADYALVLPIGHADVAALKDSQAVRDSKS